MHCSTCPADRRARCQNEGCFARFGQVDAQIRAGTPRDLALAQAEARLASQPVEEAIDRQLTRLDVETGDILVIRTRQKLKPERVAEWQKELTELCRSQGVRDVSVVVLDNCSSLTVERKREPDTRMQYQPVKGAPIVSY